MVRAKGIEQTKSLIAVVFNIIDGNTEGKFHCCSKSLTSFWRGKPRAAILAEFPKPVMLRRTQDIKAFDTKFPY